MAALYAAADYQLVTLKDLPAFHGVIPSKLPAALSCGSPVLVAAPGDCAAMVADHEIGLACPPGDWRSLADCFHRAAGLTGTERAAMSRRALDTYRARMSQRAGVDQLAEMLSEAALR